MGCERFYRALSALEIYSYGNIFEETHIIESLNVAIGYSWGDDRYDRLPALAADLVRRRVTVIAATGTGAMLAARNVTSTIPIVFNCNPVELGLVDIYTDKSLKGANPGDLSVQQPAKFELIINLKTVKSFVEHRGSCSFAPTRY